MDGIAGDPGHGGAVAEDRAEIQQRRGAAARGGALRGSTAAPIAAAASAATPPNRKAASGPPSAASPPASAKEAAPAMPTPAACQLTARDCAVPSSRSAMAFSPGM
jgi:hypothetical protein